MTASVDRGTNVAHASCRWLTGETHMPPFQPNEPSEATFPVAALNTSIPAYATLTRWTLRDLNTWVASAARWVASAARWVASAARWAASAARWAASAEPAALAEPAASAEPRAASAEPSCSDLTVNQERPDVEFPLKILLWLKIRQLEPARDYNEEINCLFDCRAQLTACIRPLQSIVISNRWRERAS
jgi:hypothetical protein